jgi:hypothetical protein
MNQFRLIAICLGLASSALGTCTSRQKPRVRLSNLANLDNF